MMDLTDETAARILAMACGMLLEEDEGICIELDNVLYTVSTESINEFTSMTSINETSDEDLIPELNEPDTKLQHGQRIWLHKREELN